MIEVADWLLLVSEQAFLAASWLDVPSARLAGSDIAPARTRRSAGSGGTERLALGDIMTAPRMVPVSWSRPS